MLVRTVGLVELRAGEAWADPRLSKKDAGAPGSVFAAANPHLTHPLPAPLSHSGSELQLSPAPAQQWLLLGQEPTEKFMGTLKTTGAYYRCQGAREPSLNPEPSFTVHEV